jgi:hypothetical protein
VGFSVQPSLSIAGPLRRDRYAFGSSADFFEVGYVIVTGGVSLVAYLR